VRLSFALIVAACAAAQAPRPALPPAGSISGVVRDAESGAPIQDAEVFANRVNSKTDDQGRYTLRDLTPGQYRVRAVTAIQGQMGFGPSQTRLVSLNAGQELSSIDFRLRPFGEISGKVVDENKEPVPQVRIFQVAREYREGALRTVFTGAATTDDRGAYVMGRVMPGRPVVLVAVKHELRLPAISDAPADPKLRRRAPMPTFYPDAISPEAGETVTLRAGEQRTGVDFRLRRSPSYCLEGVLQGGAGPGALDFVMEEKEPTSGRSGNGGFYTSVPNGKSEADGRIRICDLHPGEYTLTAFQSPSGDAAPAFYGTTRIAVSDEDLRGIGITALPRITVTGEALWDGAAPDTPDDFKLSLNLDPMTRAPWSGEKGTSASTTIPGEFAFPDLLMDEYSLDVRGLTGRMYIKDITYGTSSIFHQPLKTGSAIGSAGIRLLVARDGATLTVTAAGKEGQPAGDVDVTLIPEFAGSDAALAALIVSGRTDQNGVYRSGTLPPGKYYVLAGNVANDNTPECITKLRRARTKAKEVELVPGATMQVSVELIEI
jgi:hypothetical protein